MNTQTMIKCKYAALIGFTLLLLLTPLGIQFRPEQD